MSFLSNIFNWLGKEGDCLAPSPTTPGPLGSRKRCRDTCGPLLREEPAEDLSPRPIKFFRGETRIVPVTKPSPLECLPEDVVRRCLSFVGAVEDRFAVQNTSKQFNRLSNGDDTLRMVDVENIILDEDTVESVMKKLSPYAQASNLKALYMIGIIGTYSHSDVELGIKCLREAADRGYSRAAYASGLVLRDSESALSSSYMEAAAKAEYLPALQEILSSSELKEKYGEPSAEDLRRHLDSCCLNRLLSRHYCNSKELRVVHTSHCWNPLCGRWAFRGGRGNRVSRMKMCSRCCRAKYCSKLCQVYDWRSGRHKTECHFL